MDLEAKIRGEILDAILSDEKNVEFRQFESITLTDESGRSVRFDIEKVGCLVDAEKVKRAYPEVPWVPEKQIVALKLGEILNIQL